MLIVTLTRWELRDTVLAQLDTVANQAWSRVCLERDDCPSTPTIYVRSPRESLSEKRCIQSRWKSMRFSFAQKIPFCVIVI